MNIPVVDLTAQYASLKEEINGAIYDVVQSGQFILGPEIKAFEKETAAYLGVGFAIGVASGTDALQLALLACNVRPGDEIITTPFTFISTAEAITQCGATPTFVDIDPKTYNVDPTKIESRLTEKTKAILPVHLYGQPADMDPILELALKYDLRVIEDCAQALGAEYKGKKVGSLGDAGCLSFFPSKVLGAYGDGGMVVTNNSKIAEMVAMLRNHGCEQKYYHLVPGFNSRLDELQAAILRVKLRHLNEWIDQRRRKALSYRQFLEPLDGVEPPWIAPYSYHIFNYYTVRLNNLTLSRDKLREHFNSRGIDTAIYYPLALHLQEVYKSLGHVVGDFPESEHAQGEVLSLPMYAELSEGQIGRIVGAIKDFNQMRMVI